MTRFNNIAGKKFGKLTAIECVGKDSRYNNIWRCQCECGRFRDVVLGKLIQNKVKTCGCKIHYHYDEVGLNILYNRYHKAANSRNYVWNISKEEFKYITKQNCFYCGHSPANIQRFDRNRGEYIYNGLDRVDNKIGYSIDNVVPCCTKCNVAKNKMTIQEFKILVENIYSNWICK